MEFQLQYKTILIKEKYTDHDANLTIFFNKQPLQPAI